MFMCVNMRLMYEILHKLRCQQVRESTNTKPCIGICVRACVCVCICVPKDNTTPSLPCFLQSSTNEEPHHHCGNQGQA